MTKGSTPDRGAVARRLRPSGDALVDAAFLLVLGVLGLIGFRTTYGGVGYLVVGVVGLIIGIGVAHLVLTFRLPVVLVVVGVFVAFFVLGPVVVLRHEAPLWFLPSPAVLSELASAATDGWKRVLTTLPPVASDGPLLALPFLIGLIEGGAGFAVARRFRAVAPAVVVPMVALVVVLLLGTIEPAAEVAQGAIFAAVVFVWVAVRGIRLRPLVASGSPRRSRLLIAAGLIVGSLAVGAVVGPAVSGGSGDRVVLRSYVTPPVDISDYPSPLVGFRKYTEPAKQLADQVLFEVSGLPRGYFVRFATLDDYNQAVWTATNGTEPIDAGPSGSVPNSFRHVGETIDNPASGIPATVRFVIGRAFATAADVNAWLPSAGSVQGVEFSGPNRSGLSESFAFNLVTNQGIVPSRLSAGDTYVVRTVLGDADRAKADPPPDGASPVGTPVVSSEVTGFAAAPAEKWAGEATGPVARMLAVAEHLRQFGAFSDGGENESQYLPGHSLFRLSSGFLSDAQPVGDDEQYAAAFAIMANRLGVPARVVLGAVPREGGKVLGADVHTWVEVHLASGWYAIPRQVFMPDPSQTPDPPKPPKDPEGGNTVVPPPNPAPPRSPSDRFAKDLSQPAGGNGRSVLATFLVVIGAVARVSVPFLVVAAVCMAILFLKARRRRRRRTEGRPVDRVAAGWREMVDQANDFGVAAPVRSTRREQAAALAAFPVEGLAARADAVVFGPGDPTDETASEYWAIVDATRHAMASGATRWRRWKAAISLRSLLPRRAGRIEAVR